MKKLKQDDIDDYFTLSTIPLNYEVNKRMLYLYDSYHYDVAKYLIELRNFVSLIEEKNEEESLFFVKNFSIVCRNEKFLKEMQRNFTNLINGYNEHYYFFPVHSFHPYITVIFEQIKVIIKKYLDDEESVDKKQKFIEYFHPRVDFFIKKESKIPILENMANIFNDFILNIRKELSSKSFKISKNNYFHQLRENYKNLINYIDKLFELHDTLLVIRLDMGYINYSCPVINERIIERQQEAKDDFKLFLKNKASNSLFKHLVGYVWKLEFSAHKGFYYRILFFYQDNKKHNDVFLADKIGEYWINSVTKENIKTEKNTIINKKGCYFNSNSHKKDYRSIGIGLINQNDCSKREELEFVVQCFTKVDANARLQLMEKDKKGMLKCVRTFGKGAISSKKCK